MGKLLGNLTNPAVSMPGGGTMTSPSPWILSQQASQSLPSAAAMTGPDVLNPAPTSQAPIPSQIHQLPFLEAMRTGPGGTPNAASPGLTKGGKLLTILMGAAGGGLAAAGKRTVGEGFQAGQQLPFEQAQMRQGAQMGDIQTKTAQAQLQNLPWQMNTQRQQAAATLAKTQAETQKDVAQANVAEQKPSDKALHSYVGADGKQHVVMMRSDNSTYDKTFGDANQPEAKTLDSAALEQMRVANGGQPPTLKQIGDYQKAKAANIHIQTGVNDLDPGSRQVLRDGLLDGTLDVRQFGRMSGPARMQLIADAKKVDPKFDMTTFASRQKVANEFAGGKSADQIQSFNTFLGHAKDLSDAVNNVRLSGSPLINKPIIWLRNNAAGDPVIAAYLARITPVKDEFLTFLQNNHALTETDRHEGEKLLNENMSPAQMQASIKQVSHTAAIRLDQVNKRYKNTMHKDYPGLLAPESEDFLNQLGIKSAGMAEGNGAPPEGAKVRDYTQLH
jgi:hypothetical protein